MGRFVLVCQWPDSGRGFAQALEVEEAMEEADRGLLEAHLIAQVGVSR